MVSPGNACVECAIQVEALILGSQIPPQDEKGNLKAQTWTEALHAIQQRVQGVQGDQIRGIAGKLADAESMIALKVGSQCADFMVAVPSACTFWISKPHSAEMHVE